MIKSSSSRLELSGVSFEGMLKEPRLLAPAIPSAGTSSPSASLWDLITATSCMGVLHPDGFTKAHEWVRPTCSTGMVNVLEGFEEADSDRQTASKGPQRERVLEVGKLEDISRHEIRGEKRHHTIMGMMMLFCNALRLVTYWPLTTGKTCCFDLACRAGILEMLWVWWLLIYLNIMKGVAVATLSSHFQDKIKPWEDKNEIQALKWKKNGFRASFSRDWCILFSFS